MGTTSEAIPRTTNITPNQNKPFMYFSLCSQEVRTGTGKCLPRDAADSSYSPLDADKPVQSRRTNKTNKKNGDPFWKSPTILQLSVFTGFLRSLAPARQVFFLFGRELVDLDAHR